MKVGGVQFDHLSGPVAFCLFIQLPQAKIKTNCTKSKLVKSLPYFLVNVDSNTVWKKHEEAALNMMFRTSQQLQNFVYCLLRGVDLRTTLIQIKLKHGHSQVITMMAWYFPEISESLDLISTESTALAICVIQLIFPHSSSNEAKQACNVCGASVVLTNPI